MAKITLGGNPINTLGDLPSVGEKAPTFTLVDTDLNRITLESFGTKKKILNIVPSVDTSTCLLSAKTFQKSLSDDVVIISISRDTPFAIARVKSAESDIANSVALADTTHEFGKAYKCEIVDGPLANFLSRAVIVLDANNVVQYTEQVSEIKTEPNYAKALEAVKNL